MCYKMCGSCSILLKPNIAHINTMNSKKNGALGVSIERNAYFILIFIEIMPALSKPHQTSIRNEYIGFRKTLCGLSESQIRQFCLLT